MKNEAITEACLIEMFSRVGLDFDMEAILEYAKTDDWYWGESWSQSVEDSFRDWMDELLKKKTRWNKKTREKEIAFFLLMWGWKVLDVFDDECAECGQSGFHKMSCGSKNENG